MIRFKFVFPLFLAVFLMTGNLAKPIHPQSSQSRTAAKPYTKRLDFKQGNLEIIFNPQRFSMTEGEIVNWINRYAEGVVWYYGKFPVKQARLAIRPFDGNGVRNGATYGYGYSYMRISLGDDSTAEDFEDDWVLTHEMIHLAFPSVPGRNHWIEEGISTYVEPFIRCRVGSIDEDRIWRDLVVNLPKGQPKAGDRGLDNTPTWGRTYWGGALFCFLADVEIHKRTKNKRGLRDALIAVNQATGNGINDDWEIRRAFEIGDRATGTKALTELYDQMRDTPVTVDLDTLWKELGIEYRNGKIRYNDRAPLASVRKAVIKTAQEK